VFAFQPNTSPVHEPMLLIMRKNQLFWTMFVLAIVFTFEADVAAPVVMAALPAPVIALLPVLASDCAVLEMSALLSLVIFRFAGRSFWGVVNRSAPGTIRFPTHVPNTLMTAKSQVLPVRLVFTMFTMSACAFAAPVAMLATLAESIVFAPVLASAVAVLAMVAVLVLVMAATSMFGRLALALSKSVWNCADKSISPTCVPVIFVTDSA